MKRVYATGLFVLFLLLVAVGITFFSGPDAITGASVAGAGDLFPVEFTPYGIFAVLVLTIPGYLLIKKFKEEED
jgi:hypothetical protein